MRVIAHFSAEASPRFAWLAAFYVGEGAAEKRLPMTFHGETKAAAMSAAADWLAAERAEREFRKLTGDRRRNPRGKDTSNG